MHRQRRSVEQVIKQPKTSDTEVKKIQHVDHLLKDFGEQLLNEEFSDVTLIVDSKHFYCHKAILASRSEYFKALLFGNMKESTQSEVELGGVSSEAFQMLLAYIYTSEIDLADLSVEQIFEVFHCAHQFRFQNLVSSLSSYLAGIVNTLNVCVIFERALLFDQTSLLDVCNKYIDDFAHEIICEKSFMDLSMSVLEMILGRDNFPVEEINIFRAVHKWIQHNEKSNDKYGEILRVVRLPLISLEDLVKVVWPTQLLSENVILEAMNTRLTAKAGDIKHRGYSIVDENLATAKHGSLVQLYEGGVASNLLKDCNDQSNLNWVAVAEDNNSYSSQFPQYPNYSQYPQCKIVITLGKPFVVNCIKINQRNHNARASSYNTLETSKDGKKWHPINNVQKYAAQGWFMLCFSTTVSRHFRISIQEYSAIASYLEFIQCFYISNQPNIQS